jgi:hypothetical protein
MIYWIKTKYNSFRIKKGRKRYDKQARKLVLTKNIKDPLSDSTQYICLGDLFLESALDATALNNILEGYGITKLGEAIDPTSSPVLETLASMGRKSHFVDGFGNTISNPNYFPEIVSKSNLFHLQEYVNTRDWSVESLGGHVAERYVHNAIENQGYQVAYPPHSNNTGYDLLVEQKWFEDNNLPFIPDSELSFVDNPTGLGVLQVKNSTKPDLALEHFQDKGIEVASIPVATPITPVNESSLMAYSGKTISFSKLDIDHNEVLEVTKTEMEYIASGHFGFVDQGIKIDDISNAVDGYYGLDLPDANGLDIPYIGLLITLFISGSRSYKNFIDDKITLPAAVLNTSKEIATTGVASIGSMAATGFIATEVLGNEGGVAEIFSDALGGGIEGDLGDLGDFIESGFIITAGMWVFKKIKKLFGDTKEDPLKEIKKELDTLNVSYDKLSLTLHANRNDVVEFAESLAKGFQIDRLNRINAKLDEISLHGKKLARPLIFYFLKYAKAKQEQIISNIDENKYQFHHGKIELAIDRVKTLEDARSMRYKGIAKTIKSVIKKNQDKTALSIYDKYKNDLMKPNKKKMPIILESIIQTELSYIISMIDNISIKPTEVIKNKLIPVISEVKNQLAKVKDIYDRLVKDGVISKDKPEPNTTS